MWYKGAKPPSDGSWVVVDGPNCSPSWPLLDGAGDVGWLQYTRCTSSRGWGSDPPRTGFAAERWREPRRSVDKWRRRSLWVHRRLFTCESTKARMFRFYLPIRRQKMVFTRPCVVEEALAVSKPYLCMYEPIHPPTGMVGWCSLNDASTEVTS